MLKYIISAAAIIAFLAPTGQAGAQDNLDIRDMALPQSGQSGQFPAEVTNKVDSLDADIGLVTAAGSAFLQTYKTNVRTTRGARDITVFRDAAPAVVLVATDEGFGSGSVIEKGTILTNFHVVKGHRQVKVIFKPKDPFGKLSEGEMVTADVIKTDPLRDLALLRVASLPSQSVKPIKIAPDDSIEVGADVHAIGHPTGEAWSYTTGIVSQIRPDYEWTGGAKDIKHRATVIQTQTPINPGNSGGPLLSDDELLVGVNSFGTTGAEGLNFAVSARDVRAFLSTPAAQATTEDECKPHAIFEGRDKDNIAFLRRISLKCDDRADITIIVPDDKKKPIIALLDTERREKIDGIVFDERRMGKWNASVWDPKLEDTFPLRGIHPDGKLMPQSMEPRCRPPSRPLKDLKCS